MTWHYLDISTFCHATEDLEKVGKAVLFIASEPGAEIQVKEALGVHKNPIRILSLKLSRNKQIEAVFRHLADSGLTGILLEQQDQRLDPELVFNIRLNKQAAYNEELVLASEESRGGAVSLRAKVKAFPSNRENAMKNIKRFLEGL